MNETYVTLPGWVGGDVTLRDGRGRPGRRRFRVATHAAALPPQDRQLGRRRHPWFTVNALARPRRRTATGSLRRGDPVVVHGRLSADVWTNKAGLEVTTFEVEATFVGHDLNRGTSSSADSAAGRERERPAARDAAADGRPPAGRRPVRRGCRRPSISGRGARR